MFANVDDDQLLTTWDEAHSSPERERLRTTPATSYSLTPVLHVIASRKIESEMQEMLLQSTFAPDSNEAFHWRSAMLTKLQEWNRVSKSTPEPFQKGYVSLRWLEMIFYYHVISLFRPTKAMVLGIAGDWTTHSCCQAIILFRRFQMAREIAQPWLGVSFQLQ